jgi:hypothetical protein
VFGDRVDLVSDEPVSLAVDGVRCLRVGCIDQAEDLPRFIIHPVAQIADAVRGLGREIGLVSGSDVTGRHPAVDAVHIHEQWHVHSCLSSVRRLFAVTG